MDNRDMNDALREYRKNRLIVRDGESREAINQRLRAQAHGEREPLEERAPRKAATPEAINAALRRMARGG